MIQPNLSSTLDDVSYITKSFLPILPTAMDNAMGDDDAPSTDMDSSSSSSTNVTKSPPPRSPPKSPGINAPPKSPGSAKSWPPAIDAKAWRPKEIAAMMAEDGWPNQAAMALQALGAPKATFEDMAEDSPTSPPDGDPQSPPPYVPPAIGRMVPKTPPKRPPLAAKKSAQAPKHQAELAATSSTSSAPVPAVPVHQAKAKQPGSQAPPQAASQGGYPASQASRQATKAMPIASPDVPRTPATASQPSQHSTPASSSHAKHLPLLPANAPQSEPKAPPSQPKAPQTPPKKPAKAKQTPSGPSSWKQGQPGKSKPAGKATGWKNKLAFFTKYWIAQNFDVTTNAIVQFTTDLEQGQTRMQGITSKAMIAPPRSWQGNAYSLVHHYNQQNWAKIDGMIATWRADPHFDQLVITSEAMRVTCASQTGGPRDSFTIPRCQHPAGQKESLLPKAFWLPMCCPCFCHELSSCVLAHSNKSQVASHVVHVASIANASWPPMSLSCFLKPLYTLLAHPICGLFIYGSPCALLPLELYLPCIKHLDTIDHI